MQIAATMTANRSVHAEQGRIAFPGGKQTYSDGRKTTLAPGYHFFIKSLPMEEPTEYPIDGILDLHAFHPRDVPDLVPEYLRVCRERGILRVRIVHGKGTGALRRTVHAVLDRLDEVASYRLADDASGWGATLVFLEAPDACSRFRDP
jgi:hypothetical protein